MTKVAARLGQAVGMLLVVAACTLVTLGTVFAGGALVGVLLRGVRWGAGWP